MKAKSFRLISLLLPLSQVSAIQTNGKSGTTRMGTCAALDFRRASGRSGPLRILWGIESCGQEDYENMVKAQLETWGSGIPRENFVIVGGRYDDANFGLAAEPMPCSDSMSGISCKESVMLDRAVSRAKQLDADWLTVSQDDKYIVPSRVQRELERYDSRRPVVVTPFGCGQAWQYHKESLNGTKPLPPGFRAPAYSCKEVYEQGGMCGGPAYFVSRGAIDLLHTKGQTSADFRKEYLEGSEASTRVSDIYSSCLMYKRHIPLAQTGAPYAVVRHDGARFNATPQGIREAVAESFREYGAAATLHIDDVPKRLIADYIREFHNHYY